jgi:hypothetical protein
MLITYAGYQIWAAGLLDLVHAVTVVLIPTVTASNCFPPNLHFPQFPETLERFRNLIRNFKLMTYAYQVGPWPPHRPVGPFLFLAVIRESILDKIDDKFAWTAAEFAGWQRTGSRGNTQEVSYLLKTTLRRHTVTGSAASSEVIS